MVNPSSVFNNTCETTYTHTHMDTTVREDEKGAHSHTLTHIPPNTCPRSGTLLVIWMFYLYLFSLNGIQTYSTFCNPNSFIVSRITPYLLYNGLYSPSTILFEWPNHEVGICALYVSRKGSQWNKKVIWCSLNYWSLVGARHTLIHNFFFS